MLFRFQAISNARSLFSSQKLNTMQTKSRFMKLKPSAEGGGKPIILTTNKVFTHKAELLKIEAESYRLKEAKEREERRKAKKGKKKTTRRKP